MEKHPQPRMGTEGDVIGKRLIAFLIDTFIVGIGSAVVLLVGFAIGETVGLFLALVVGIASLVYLYALEGIYGYTPGKSLVGLVVVKDDGSDCTLGASIVRNLLLFVDQLPFLYIIGIVLLLVTDRNQRVGDLVASTVVVEQR